MTINSNPNGVIQYERKGAGKSRIRSIIAMTHLMAVVIFSTLAWVSAIFALGQIPSLRISVLLIVAMACIQITIGMSNEIFDRDIDAISKPWRAIPAGHISVRWSIILTLLVCAIGLWIAFLISTISAMILSINLAAGIAYNAKLKRTGFSWLPYLIGYPVAPIWAWVSVGSFEPRQLAIYILAAPFAIATHLCNQLRDFEEDELAGIGGVVQYLGKERATKLCYWLLAISPIPVIAFTLPLGQPVLVVSVIIASLIHFRLTMPIYYTNRWEFPASSFRKLFRNLQLCGLLLSLSCIWVLTA